MRPLRARSLLAAGVVAAVLAWFGLGTLDQQGVPLPLPWTAPAVLLVLAVTVVVVGAQVRALLRGRTPRRFDALRAARTAVLAQAASATGATLVGVYTGIALVLVPTFSIEPRRADLVRALVALLTAVVLLVAGVVVARWCRLPPDDDEAERRRALERERRGPVAPHDGSNSHREPPGSRGHPGSR